MWMDQHKVISNVSSAQATTSSKRQTGPLNLSQAVAEAGGADGNLSHSHPCLASPSVTHPGMLIG